jgi:hypothetical protein
MSKWKKQLRETKQWLAEAKNNIANLPTTTVGRDRDATYNAPVKAAKKLVKIAKELRGQATYWGKCTDMSRLYFADDSYLWVDETGLVRTSGGLATKAKFVHEWR